MIINDNHIDLLMKVLLCGTYIKEEHLIKTDTENLCKEELLESGHIERFTNNKGNWLILKNFTMEHLYCSLKQSIFYIKHKL